MNTSVKNALDLAEMHALKNQLVDARKFLFVALAHIKTLKLEIPKRVYAITHLMRQTARLTNPVHLNN